MKHKKNKKKSIKVYPTFTDYYEGNKLKRRRGLGGFQEFC